MVPENRETINNTAAESDNKAENREVYAEKAETKAPEMDEDKLRALALAYARYLASQDLAPGDATFVEPEELTGETQPVNTQEEDAPELIEEAGEEDAPAAEEPAKEAAEKPAKKAPARKHRLYSDAEPDEQQLRRIEASLDKRAAKRKRRSVVDAYDSMQEKVCEGAAETGRDFVRAGHKLTSTYRQSRRFIGLILLLIGVFAAVVLAIFDRYTVYEYAYNGKILGYVKNQEDVIGVLDIAGSKMSEDETGDSEVEFTANQNVTFNLVDARGKSIDDADTAINKFVYMTDIETEAFGIYDGDVLVAVVKSEKDAEFLLNQALAVLSEPDKGMEVVSADYTNELSIRPVNVLLTSVQSNEEALEKMTKGGETEIYHIAESSENLGSIARVFAADPINIYDEENKNVVTEIEQGDTVCIHNITDPVSVKMVETGRMKETIEFETIKKKSDDYYEGDTHIEQEGVDGKQIFEGSITKVGGEVTERDEDHIEVIREKKDKIILVGTAERPKTAPTGTYVMPIHNYVLTSNFGFRWGRLHAGIDMGAPTGEPIYATDGGTVVKAEYYSGYGNVVFVQHEDGRQTRYAHCSQLLVNYGDKVYQGQLIALVGNTGHSFGSHLHFEVRLNDNPVDPRPFLGI